MKTKKQYIPVLEASELVGVGPKTIRAWYYAGKVKGKIVKWGKERKVVRIDKSSLPRKFNAKCLFCGKKLKPKHLSRIKYCSPRHAALYHYYKNKK